MQLLLMLVLLAAAAAPARAQVTTDALREEAFRFAQPAPMTGARMAGFAGAGIAGFADYGMLTTNPAGLAYFESSQATGSFGLLTATDEGAYGQEGSVVQGDLSTVVPGALGLIYTFPTVRGSLVFGAGFSRTRTFGRELRFGGTNEVSSLTTSFLPFDEEYVYDPETEELTFPANIPSSDLPFIAFRAGAIEFFPGDYDAGVYPFEQAGLFVPLEQQGDVLTEGAMNEVNFGGAFEAAPGVMLGLGLNVVFGSYRFNHFFEEIDQGENFDYEVIRGGRRHVGLDAVTYEETFASEVRGVNLRGGVSTELTEGARLGLTVETPSYYRIERDFSLELATFFLEGGALAYGGQPNDVGTGTITYEVQTPWRLGLGAALSTLAFTDGAVDLTLRADAQYVDWSQTELSADDPLVGDAAAGANRTFRDAYDATIETRLGAEYRQGPLALRAGLAYQPDPYDPDPRDVAVEPPDRSRTFLTAGLGYRVSEQVELDVAFVQERFEDAFRPYPEDSVGPRQDEVLLIGEDVRRTLFMIGLRYSF